MNFKSSHYASSQDSSLSKTHLVSSQSSTFYPISPITCTESSSSNMPHQQLETSPSSPLASSSSSLSVSDLVCSDISLSTDCSKPSNNGHFPVSKSNPTHSHPNQLPQETPTQTRHHKTVSSSSVFPSNSSSTSNTLLQRPNMIRFYSTPTLSGMSPTRQHFRLANSHPRQIKETLNASLRVDETGKTLNQYFIKKEIGAGTFGTVWKVIDTITNEVFAMKEYSKSSLRKHLRSELLSQRRAAMRKNAGRGHRPSLPSQKPLAGQKVDESSLGLIRREFAIAKKLDHPNIVILEEVLDNPEGDSLYLILEWCGKGPLKPAISDYSNSDLSNDDKNIFSRMHLDSYNVDIGNLDKPVASTSVLTEEQCRLYFRDMILGIEYLHSQGVIHRDIKADNLLLDDDDVLKIADFGVSELFNEQEGENDIVTKTAGSPAYMAPELAIISNGTLMHLAATKDIPTHMLSGKSTDIWSMGVTLYYMIFGILPFRADNVMDLYSKIVTEDFEYPQTVGPLNADLCDLFNKILCKSPQKRIKMDQLRTHSWVTLNGQDPLLSKEENTADTITPVTEEDLISAIERIQGLGHGFEPEQVITGLKRLHGWRYDTSSLRSSVIGSSLTSDSTASSICNSRSPSVSPFLAPTTQLSCSPSSSSLSQLSDDNISVHRLTRALEEVVQRKKHASTVLSQCKVLPLYHSKHNNSVESLNTSGNIDQHLQLGEACLNSSIPTMFLENNDSNTNPALSLYNFDSKNTLSNALDNERTRHEPHEIHKLEPALIATLTYSKSNEPNTNCFGETKHLEDDVHATIDSPDSIGPIPLASVLTTTAEHLVISTSKQDIDRDMAGTISLSFEETNLAQQSTGPSTKPNEPRVQSPKPGKMTLLGRKLSKSSKARTLLGLTARAH